jgi:MFS transporter, ACS family, glucarate transporter
MNPTRRPWPLVSMLCATATAGYICRVNVSIAGALLTTEFGLDQVQMGRVFSAFLLGYAACQIPGGLLADRWGARRVLSLAAWGWVAITAFQAAIGRGPFPAAPTAALATLMALRFLMGVAAAPTYPSAAQGISRWVPAALQGRANGIVIASVGLGSALAPPLVSHVMVRWGWRPALLASALPALAIAVLWRLVQAPAQPPALTPTPSESAALPSELPCTPSSLRSPRFALLTLSYSLQGYVGYIFVTWFYLYLVQERHFGLLTGAWMSSLPWVLSIVSIPLGGFVSDWLSAGFLGPTWGRRLVAMVGMAGSGILISVGAHTDNAVTAAVSLAVATALVLCVEGPFWSAMLSIAGSGRGGAAGGIMNTGCNLGGLLSPVLTPLVASWLGWEVALHLAAGLAVLAAALWIGVREV